MPLKVNIKTSLETEHQELDIETCQEVIRALNDTYQTIRSDIYAHMLGFKTLRMALSGVCLSLILYFMTHEILYLYMMPVIVSGTMIAAMIFAEYLTSTARKEIRQRITHFQEILNDLKRQKLYSQQ